MDQRARVGALLRANGGQQEPSLAAQGACQFKHDGNPRCVVVRSRAGADSIEMRNDDDAKWPRRSSDNVQRVPALGERHSLSSHAVSELFEPGRNHVASLALDGRSGDSRPEFGDLGGEDFRSFPRDRATRLRGCADDRGDGRQQGQSGQFVQRHPQEDAG